MQLHYLVIQAVLLRVNLRLRVRPVLPVQLIFIPLPIPPTPLLRSTGRIAISILPLREVRPENLAIIAVATRRRVRRVLLHLAREV